MDELLHQLDLWLRPVGGRKTLYAVIFIFVVVTVLRRLFSRPRPPPYLVQRQCDCGWRGSVSKFAPTCPRCGNPLAD